MKIWLLGVVVFSFLAGMFMHPILESRQIPSSPLDTAEKASPQDWISQSQIHVYQDRVVIDLEDAKWARFADTNSMDPVLDAGSNGIQVVPSSPEQLAVGDIITYDRNGDKIIHRIVEIGQDSEGYYFIVKGDNNAFVDPGKVRFDDIDRVLVAVIY